MIPTLNECVTFLRKDIAIELRRANQKTRFTVGQLADKSAMPGDVIADALDKKPGLTIKGLAKMAGAMGCRVQVIFIPFDIEIADK